MKSKTTDWQVFCWLISWIGIILFPVGFLYGLLALGFNAGKLNAERTVKTVWDEWNNTNN